ncbi:DUF4435 domain-containing protein [Acinetobacter seifertii]|uniref:DUF4435 domain-containing protein n=5 Tax=Acinetobacter seifertii TaxID=1530123 RepID=A0A7H2QN10_9GAMM|nr:DUF4435 domain-containing protein [Acinetobacter seifertii]QNX06057.1 DUF4435 domain-containing protein [Acinetobacter seifertii]QNX16493.1 DUF4435 domain-containing protein [Acinetobacter seifertii]
MTNRKEKMSNFKNEISVIFRDYIKSRRLKKEAIQLIVEGVDDPKYYTTRFNIFLNPEWNITSVGGKSKVLGLKEIIEKHPSYKNDECYYFIDKDYDERIFLDKTYCTPTYSIENFYLHPTCITNLVTSECGLSNYSIKERYAILDYINSDYLCELENFHKNKKIIKINSVFKFIRNNEIPTTSLDKVLKIELHSNSIKIKHLKEYQKLKIENIKNYRKFLETEDYHKFISSPLENFRGKQEILFLKYYLKRLYNDGELSKEIYSNFGVKIKLENPAMADKILSNVSNYAYTPDCLKNFLLTIKSSK